MKLTIKELLPNPYKKQINKGKLIEEQVKRIQSNIKELGLMGSLPVFKKEGKYFLISGHHRLEALKRTFGKDYKIEVTLHNYSDENILRGMVIENVSQRGIEYNEITANLVAIRKWLRKTCPLGGQVLNKGSRGPSEEPGSIRNVERWLNLNGDVLHRSSIEKYLSIEDNLSPELKREIKTAKPGKSQEDLNEEGILSTKQAQALAKFKDYKEQGDLREALKKSKLNGVEQLSRLTQYNNAPDKVKQEVREGKTKIDNIEDEIINYKVNNSEKIRDDKELKKKLIQAQTWLSGLRGQVTDTSTQLQKTLKMLVGTIQFIQLMDDNQKEKLTNQLDRLVELLTKNLDFSEKIKEKINNE